MDDLGVPLFQETSKWGDAGKTPKKQLVDASTRGRTRTTLRKQHESMGKLASDNLFKKRQNHHVPKLFELLALAA